METSLVRKRITDTIDQAKRAAAERRARTDEAARDYARFLDQTAVPLFRQIAGTLKASNFNFTVFTPGGSVRLMSDKTAEDFVELTLDTAGDRPVVMGRTSRSRGRRVIESERPVANVPVADVSDEQLLDFMAVELARLVER